MRFLNEVNEESEINDEGKTLLLAQVCKLDGLQVSQVLGCVEYNEEPYFCVHWLGDDSLPMEYEINLYNLKFFALAWRILNWASKQFPDRVAAFWNDRWATDKFYSGQHQHGRMYDLDAETFQRMLLDNVVSWVLSDTGPLPHTSPL